MLMLERLTENFETTFAMPDEDIMRQNVKDGEFMYFILKGQVKVTVENLSGHGGRVRWLSESQYFGEIAMFYNCERQATIKSNSYNTYARINKTFFDQFCLSYPQARKALRELIWHYNDSNQVFRKSLILHMPYVKKQTPKLAQLDLIYSLRTKYVEKGQSLQSLF